MEKGNEGIRFFSLTISLTIAILSAAAQTPHDRNVTHPFNAKVSDQSKGVRNHDRLKENAQRIVNESFATDTITFNEYAGDTPITNQYLDKGVLFSGFENTPPPWIEDYGGNLGRVLRSYNWYDGILIRFVEPSDTTVYRPVNAIGFKNPAASEVDFIIAKIYDAQDRLVHRCTSASPEQVNLTMDSPIGAYMVIDDSANTAFIIDDLIISTGPVGIQSDMALSPCEFRLLPNYPNPFNPVTTIRYQLARPSQVELSIFNSKGQKVQSLANGMQSPGIHSVEWNGRDETGTVLNSGLYICLLKVEGRIQSRKMLLLK